MLALCAGSACGLRAPFGVCACRSASARAVQRLRVRRLPRLPRLPRFRVRRLPRFLRLRVRRRFLLPPCRAPPACAMRSSSSSEQRPMNCRASLSYRALHSPHPWFAHVASPRTTPGLCPMSTSEQCVSSHCSLPPRRLRVWRLRRLRVRVFLPPRRRFFPPPCPGSATALASAGRPGGPGLFRLRGGGAFSGIGARARRRSRAAARGRAGAASWLGGADRHVPSIFEPFKSLTQVALKSLHFFTQDARPRSPSSQYSFSQAPPPRRVRPPPAVRPAEIASST
jgi:hypothetical protein